MIPFTSNHKRGFYGSVEILERNKQSLLGAPAHRASASAARASLWGREGVTLLAAAENK
jgi:hypothetical protein